MIECPHFEHLLVIPHLRVQNANAISSPLTHGFPSMTAFLGLMWALERKTTEMKLDLWFNAVGVVCHDYQEQIASNGYERSFCLTRNPLEKKGSTAAIVEEGRIHLEITLIFAVQGEALNALGGEDEKIAAQIREHLMQMRIAGGSLIPSKKNQKPYVLTLTSETRAECFKRLKYRLLPGFTLVARDDLLDERHKLLQKNDSSASRLDAWLSLSRINWRSAPTRDGKVIWKHDREQGWIVPIPVGYGALSGPHPSGSIANARDDKTPFCFVEGLYSIGQWLSPHRLQTPKQLLWYPEYQESQGLYRCRNDYQPPQTDEFHD